MSLLIRGGRLIDPSMELDEKADLWIEQGVIKDVIPSPQAKSVQAEKVIEADRWVVAPGFVDLHTHLRDPGQTAKEDIESGTAAAVAGGFTSILCMPNTDPVNDSVEVTRLIQDRAKRVGKCRVFPIGALTLGQKGEALAPLRELREAGCIAFSDDGRPCFNSALFRQAMLACRELNVPVMEHCEELTLAAGPTLAEGAVAQRMGFPGLPKSSEVVDVARTVALAVETGAHVHLSHLSCAESVELLEAYRDKAHKLSAEVTPHHLLLTDEAVGRLGTQAKMSPPLRSDRDREALITALQKGLIEAVATDHAPHTEAEKDRPFAQAPNGVIGLETAFPVLGTLLEAGKLTLLELIDRLSTSPARLANLQAGSLKKGMPADLVLLDLTQERDFSKETFRSKSQNSPFGDFPGKGRVVKTFVGGKEVFGAA